MNENKVSVYVEYVVDDSVVTSELLTMTGVPAVGEVIEMDDGDYRVETVRWSGRNLDRWSRRPHVVAVFEGVGPRAKVVAADVAGVIWDTSRADEGTISATGANIVAAELLSKFKMVAR